MKRKKVMERKKVLAKRKIQKPFPKFCLPSNAILVTFRCLLHVCYNDFRFGYIAKAIGPHDVLATLLNNLKVQERQNRVCTTVAIAIVAETCSPFTVLPGTYIDRNFWQKLCLVFKYGNLALIRVNNLYNFYFQV